MMTSLLVAGSAPPNPSIWRTSGLPYQAYGGQRYADLNGVQMAALNQTADRAMNGSETINNAEAALNCEHPGADKSPPDQMVGKAQDSVSKPVQHGRGELWFLRQCRACSSSSKRVLATLQRRCTARPTTVTKPGRCSPSVVAQQFGNQAP